MTPSIASALAGQATVHGSTGNSLPIQLALIVVGAIIGSAASYGTTRLNARHDPRKQLTWEASTDRGLVAVGPQIRNNVRIQYLGAEVSNLVAIKCRVSNTGNQLVKNETLRFAFPSGTKILEADFAPMPEPELRASRIAPGTANPTEEQFLIGHMEAGQEVSFEFIASGPNAEKWGVHQYNEDGGVDFRQRDVGRIRDEQEHIQPFLVLGFLFLAIPAIFDGFSFLGDDFAFSITGAAVLLVRLAIFILLFPHIAPVMRIIQRLVSRWLTGPEPTTSVTVEGGNPQFVATSGQVTNLEFRPPGEHA